MRHGRGRNKMRRRGKYTVSETIKEEEGQRLEKKKKKNTQREKRKEII